MMTMGSLFDGIGGFPLAAVPLLHTVFAQEPVITAIGFHLGDFAVEEGDDGCLLFEGWKYKPSRLHRAERNSRTCRPARQRPCIEMGASTQLHCHK